MPLSNGHCCTIGMILGLICFIVILHLSIALLLIPEFVINHIIPVFIIETLLHFRAFAIVTPSIANVGFSRQLIIVVVNISIIVTCDILAIIVSALIVSRFENNTMGFFNDGRSIMIRRKIGICAHRNFPQINLFYLA